MKKLFFFFLNESEKVIHELVAENDTNYLNEQSIERFLKVYQSGDEQITPYEMTESLFKKIPKIVTWMGSLKALLAIHQLNHTLGADFIIAFSSLKLPDYSEQKKKAQTNIKLFTHITLVEAYQNYLKKLNYNYEDFKVVFDRSIDLYEHLLQQNLTLLHLLSKVQNILTLLLKFDLLFEVCLLQYQNEPILRQAAYFILTDCCHFYNFVSNSVLIMIEEIFNLPAEEAIFLYEIYSENIHATKKLKKFLDFRSFLQDFEIREPIYYPVDTQLNKKIEIFINGLKVQTQNGRRKRTSILHKNLSTDYGIETKTTVTIGETSSPVRRSKTQLYLDTLDGEDDKIAHTEKGAEKNISDLTKDLLTVETPSFQIDSQRPLRTVFYPPKLQELKQKPSERQQQNQIITTKKVSTLTSVRYESVISREKMEESTREEEPNPVPYFIRKPEVVVPHFGQSKDQADDHKKAVQKKVPGKQEKQSDGNFYIAANDTTLNRTPNESFTDSFINPRGRFEQALEK